MTDIAWVEGLVVDQDGRLARWQGQEQNPGTLTMSGPCLRCGATFTHEVSGTTLIVTAAAQGAAAFDAPILISCACSEHHEGRPGPKKGCGASWVARPSLDEASGRYGLQRVDDRKLVDAALVSSSARVEEAGLRALAEKWIPAIAAVTGALGLASVVVAEDAVEGLAWPWRVAAFAAVAVAVIAAACATALVYRAAFGWPKALPTRTEEQLLAAVGVIRDRNSGIAAKLRWGVGLSFVALVALLFGLAILWLQPDTTPPVEVTYTEAGSAVTLCGKLAAVENGSLQLTVTQGPRTAVIEVPLSAVTDVAQVPKCGG